MPRSRSLTDAPSSAEAAHSSGTDSTAPRPDVEECDQLSTLLLARRSFLEIKRRSLDEALQEIYRELDQLEIALNVIGRIAADEEPEFEEARLAAVLSMADGRQVAGAGWRTPSVPQMIRAVLAHGPMTSRELLRAIRRDYVPDISASAITPTAWRMAKQGRINKKGRAYSLAE